MESNFHKKSHPVILRSPGWLMIGASGKALQLKLPYSCYFTNFAFFKNVALWAIASRDV